MQKLHVDIGDHVEAGQLLVELFLPEVQDELNQKTAAVAQANAEVELATAAIRAAEASLATARANVTAAEAGGIRAEADVTRWQSQFTRISQLVSGGSLDRKLEDEARDSLKAAEAARAEAPRRSKRPKRRCGRARPTWPRPRQTNWSPMLVSAARRPIVPARKPCCNTRKSAPYRGVVTERNVNRGDFVQPASGTSGKPLLTVAQADPVRIFVDVAELDAPFVEPGRKGFVNVQALPDKPVEGKVTRTSWILNANRTLRAELDIPNPSGALRPGMYATSHIVLQEVTDGLIVPLSTVVRDGAKTACWIVRDGKAVRVPIVVGLQVGNEVAIASGLKGDEQVVQTPPSSLQVGQAVDANPPEKR